MKRFLLFIVPLVVVLSSCHTREMAYISDAQRDSAQAILANYNTIILPGDQLDICVECHVPQSTVPFNQKVLLIRHQRSGMVDADITSERHRVIFDSLQVVGYIVNERGTIDFPLLGELSVVGITYDSLARYIEKRLVSEDYVFDPTVTVSLMNFRVTVVGEVNEPQQIRVEGNRLTIFEALAICGDITDYGQRENLTVVRTKDGVQEVGEIDLTKKEALESPYYYLQNNDIVYVEPTERKKRASDRDPNMPRYIAIGVSVLNLIRTSVASAVVMQRMN